MKIYEFALQLAKKPKSNNEIPVGSIIVREQQQLVGVVIPQLEIMTPQLMPRLMPFEMLIKE